MYVCIHQSENDEKYSEKALLTIRWKQQKKGKREREKRGLLKELAFFNLIL